MAYPKAAPKLWSQLAPKLAKLPDAFYWKALCCSLTPESEQESDRHCHTTAVRSWRMLRQWLIKNVRVLSFYTWNNIFSALHRSSNMAQSKTHKPFSVYNKTMPDPQWKCIFLLTRVLLKNPSPNIKGIVVIIFTITLYIYTGGR